MQLYTIQSQYSSQYKKRQVTENACGYILIVTQTHNYSCLHDVKGSQVLWRQLLSKSDWELMNVFTSDRDMIQDFCQSPLLVIVIMSICIGLLSVDRNPLKPPHPPVYVCKGRYSMNDFLNEIDWDNLLSDSSNETN